MEQPLETLFLKRTDDFLYKTSAFRKKYNLISITRSISAVGIITCLVISLYKIYPQLFLTGFFLLTVLFVYLVILHRKIEDDIIHSEFLTHINQNELNCLEGKTGNNFNGSLYQDSKHPYASDLDLFGAGSLYQYFCRAWTKGGRDLLSSWLAHKTDRTEAGRRQEAVKELFSNLDWRQELEARAMGLKYTEASIRKNIKQENVSELNQWLTEPFFLVSNTSTVYFIFAFQALTAASIVGVMIALPLKFLLLPVAVNAFFNSRYSKKIKDLRDKTSDQIRYLKSFR
jgi:hypothetical protein